MNTLYYASQGRCRSHMGREAEQMIAIRRKWNSHVSCLKLTCESAVIL